MRLRRSGDDAAARGPHPLPEPEPTPYNGPENPLTGEPISGELANRRPIAVMLNNLKEALPQLGQSAGGQHL
ncbi:MAG: DUF3048 domain-containing protein [Intestinimonas sp.]